MGKLEGFSFWGVANEFGTVGNIVEQLSGRFYETESGTRRYSYSRPAKLPQMQIVTYE